MDEKQWEGLQMGVAIGFDMDTDDLEAFLEQRGLSQRDGLATCQAALRESMSKEQWQAGIAAIRDASGD